MRTWVRRAATFIAARERSRLHPLADLAAKLVVGGLVVFWAFSVLGVAVFALPNEDADPIYSWMAIFVGFVAPAALLWLLFRPRPSAAAASAERTVLELLRPGAPLTAVDVALRSTLTIDQAKATLSRLAAGGHVRTQEQDGGPAYYLWRDEALPAREEPAFEPLEPLSDREREVLRYLAEGRSNKEIAAELVIALGTVKTHTNNIYRKLGARNRVEALARAREAGVL